MSTGKITFVLSDELEKRLRTVAQRKGDLSKIAECAIDNWLIEEERDKNE